MNIFLYNFLSLFLPLSVLFCPFVVIFIPFLFGLSTLRNIFHLMIWIRSILTRIHNTGYRALVQISFPGRDK